MILVDVDLVVPTLTGLRRVAVLAELFDNQSVTSFIYSHLFEVGLGECAALSKVLSYVCGQVLVVQPLVVLEQQLCVVLCQLGELQLKNCNFEK